MRTHGITVALGLAVSFSVSGLAKPCAGQAAETRKQKSPTFKVLNNSKADANITLDEVLDAYEKALGGKDAINMIQTVVIHAGMMQASAGAERLSNLDQYLKSPNKMMSVITNNDGNVALMAYDGQNGWVQMPDGVRQKATLPDVETVRDLDVLTLLHIRKAFPDLTLTGASKVEGKDVYVVDIPKSKNGVSRGLFFDAKTKLLVSDTIVIQHQSGVEILEESVADYKEADGFTLPRTLRTNDFGSSKVSTTKITRVIFNTPLNDDLFSMANEMPDSNLAVRQLPVSAQGVLIDRW